MRVGCACLSFVSLHRDIPARYLLRLGMGERDLDVDDDFSRAGRVNNMLARRLTLLAEVRALVLLLCCLRLAVICIGLSGLCAAGRVWSFSDADHLSFRAKSGFSGRGVLCSIVCLAVLRCGLLCCAGGEAVCPAGCCGH